MQKQSLTTKISTYGYSNSHQQGFTLIEMMIALLLGLVVAAAAFQVFYISQRTSTTQKSASAIQDNAVFGLNLLEQHIKLANLNYNGNSILTGSTPNGGIILTADNAPTALKGSDHANSYTRQAVSTVSTLKTTDDKEVKSDQLTIQFTVPQAMSDCEGSSVSKDAQLVQRYYLRDGGLYCDSNLTGGFGDSNGVEIINNVDQFRVLLLTDNGIDTPNSYVATTRGGGAAAIHGVKLGFVFAGATPTIDAAGAAPTLFGTQFKLADDATNTIRRVYEPTILFRNARS